MVIFEHIPKCGGTFIFEKMKKYFKYVSLGPGTGNSELSKQIEHHFNENCETEIIDISENVKNIDDIELIRAHSLFCNIVPSANNYLFTMYRNPVDSFYSEFLHSRRDSPWDDKMKQELNDHIDSLENWRFTFYEKYKKFNLILLYEYYEKSLKILNECLNINVENDCFINVNTHVDKHEIYNYNRYVVENKCRDSLFLYNEIKMSFEIGETRKDIWKK